MISGEGPALGLRPFGLLLGLASASTKPKLTDL
jgi:hypothetical protein